MDESGTTARGMHPVRRLAFRVLVQAVEDTSRGIELRPDELRSLSDWATVAGLAEHYLTDTIERARAGTLPSVRHLFPGAAYPNAQPIEARAAAFLKAAAR